MDSVSVTPKTSAALQSPKILKTAKPFPTTTSIPTVLYGCEHVQSLFKENQTKSCQQYSRILQTIFEKPNVVSQTRRSPGSDAGRPCLPPTFLCLQCPNIHSEEQRVRHREVKAHALSVESRSGHLYCQECEDYIYDPAMEEIRMQKGRRKRKLDEYLSNAEDAKLVHINSQPVPCRANGLRGLYNMGQTCFMSAIIQSLVHNPFIRTFYLNEGHKNSECEKEVSGCTSCAMDEIFTEYYSVEKTEGFGAVNMLMASWLSAHSLAGYQQQDAHEYMQFLFHALHSENRPPSDTSQSEANCNCIMHNTFYGKLQSTVTCDKCKNTTTANDPVMDLSLDLRSQAKKRKMEKSDGEAAAQSKDMCLEDCLERFTGKERLASGEYTCQNCKGEQHNATKQLSIQKLPPALPIHLKRFEHSKANASKLETKIRFPLQLDMYPYTTRARSSKSSSPLSNSAVPSCTYELSTVVVHKGKIDSGHYVSYSREGSEWFMFDDSKVVLSTEADVLGAEAYLLFYVVREFD